MSVRKPTTQGERFGRLVVLREAPFVSGHSARAICVCDCSMLVDVKVSNLRNGTTKSCGCYMRDRIREATSTHGRSRSTEFKIWSSMLARCGNPKNSAYPRYGGRGIVVCERWRKFENFLADMGQRPSGMSLDRYPNNDGNYEPGNCRWATCTEQSLNTRSNRLVTFNGRTQSVTEWEREYGFQRGTLHQRLFRYGWTMDRAVEETNKIRHAHRSKGGTPPN